MRVILKDPYGVVPVGWSSRRHCYKVIGFCDPAGLKFDFFMVDIEHGSGSQTTMDYAVVLKHFLIERQFESEREDPE